VAYDPPSRFDLINTVRLAGADGTTRGVIDGLSYYTMDSMANIVGLDVGSGKTLWSTPLLQSGTSTTWACPVQVVDDQNVYTLAADQAPDDAPTPVTLTAVDKRSGHVAWRYKPAISGHLYPDYCDVAPNYQLTVTKAGLLLSIIGSSDGQYSEMLDSTSGAALWHSDNTVQATGDAAYGIAISPPITTPGGSPVKVRTINLTTGVLGDVLVDVGYLIFYTPVVFLAGQAGDNLVIARQDQVQPEPGQDVNGATWTMQITLVSASTGHPQQSAPLTITPAGWDTCTVATDTTLVCTTQDQDGVPTAYGIALADGKTLWQHSYAPANNLLVPSAATLYHGYLYGTDPTNGDSFVLDTATGDVLSHDSYPQLTAVNQFGAVFAVVDATGTAWQTWWAPAIG